MRVSYYFYVGIDSISIETIQGISLNWIHRFKIPLNFPLWPNWQSVSAIASSFVVVMPDMTKTIIDLGCILLPQIKPVTPPQWLQHSCLMYRNSHIHVGIFLSCDTDTNVICSTHYKCLLPDLSCVSWIELHWKWPTHLIWLELNLLVLLILTYPPVWLMLWVPWWWVCEAERGRGHFLLWWSVWQVWAQHGLPCTQNSRKSLEYTWALEHVCVWFSP